jgi:hypothetical protein
MGEEENPWENPHLIHGLYRLAPSLPLTTMVTDDRGCCLVAVFGMVPHQSPMRR